VRALVRDPGKARDRLGPDSRLEIITGDLGTPADLEAAFRGADAVRSPVPREVIIARP